MYLKKQSPANLKSTIFSLVINENVILEKNLDLKKGCTFILLLSQNLPAEALPQNRAEIFMLAYAN